MKLALVNRRGLREVAGVSLALSEGLLDPESDVLPIPVVAMDELVRGEARNVIAKVCVFPPEESSISFAEACALAILMHKANAKRVFEFGTFRGVSTAQLVLNAPDDGEIFTLDLPANDPRTQFSVTEEHETKLTRLQRKGDLIPESLRGRVRFLAQDSALFDSAPYRDSMDFVFVDGAHTAEYVANDSEKAWAMLRSGGIVAWHDCRPESPAVARYLRACRFRPRRIQGTTVAFAIKP